MRRRPLEKTPRATEEERLIQELSGYCEMGMQEEALRLVDRLLVQKSLSPRLFNEAIDALLSHADNLKEWTGRIEKAYAGLSLRHTRMTRSVLLVFYHSIVNGKLAASIHRSGHGATVEA